MSKFLPDNIIHIFGPPFHNNDDEDFVPPPRLLEVLSEIATTPTPTPAPPPVKFGMDDEIVRFNIELYVKTNMIYQIL